MSSDTPVAQQSKAHSLLSSRVAEAAGPTRILPSENLH